MPANLSHCPAAVVPCSRSAVFHRSLRASCVISNMATHLFCQLRQREHNLKSSALLLYITPTQGLCSSIEEAERVTKDWISWDGGISRIVKGLQLCSESLVSARRWLLLLVQYTFENLTPCSATLNAQVNIRSWAFCVPSMASPQLLTLRCKLLLLGCSCTNQRLHGEVVLPCWVTSMP